MSGLKIETERLSLELISTSDYPEIHNLLCFPEVDKYNVLGIPESIADTIRIIEPLIKDQVKALTFAIRIAETRAFIGMCGIKIGREKYKSAEIWYKYLPSEWGRGYATETTRSLLKYCFETLNLHRVEAGCAVGNIASIKVLEKVGMLKEGHKRQNLPLKTGWSDNYEFAILKTDWLC